MSLIVEDGTGLSNAESYQSVAAATVYHAAMGNTAWAALSNSAMEIALRKATQYIDAYYTGRFRGMRLSSTQALQCPRTGAYDDDGFYIQFTPAMPAGLLAATSELALISTTDDLMPSTDTPAGTLATSITVGPIRESIQYGGANPSYPYFRKPHMLIKFLVEGGGRIRRG